MGRHIGARIIECCKIVETLGAASYRQVFEHLNCVEPGNANKYCERAVSHGLMTVDLSVYPKQFRVVHGWPEKIEDLKVKLRKTPVLSKKEIADFVVCAAMRTQVNSIFAFGARA